MRNPNPVTETHKLGVNHKEVAHKLRRRRGPSESKDIREDRGTRQNKLGARK